MTIPSRPAPPPPQPSTWANRSGLHISNNSPTLSASSINLQSSQSNYTNISSSASSKSFSTSSSNTYDAVTYLNGNSFLQEKTGLNIINKKIPPPRPPPPRINPNVGFGVTVLKKPGPPQSINVLSNIFGKKRVSGITKQSSPKIPHPSIGIMKTQPSNLQRLQDGDVQLISFDSPPSSPTLTQKSNSDCVSIGSFSSDSNFSSPNSGSTSQPESGFEDDFTSPPDPWEAISNDLCSESSKAVISDLKVTQPIRNLHAINKIQPDIMLCNGKSLLPPTATLTMPTIIKPKELRNQRNSSPVYSIFGKTINSAELSLENTDDSLPSPPMPSCPPPPPPANSSDVLGVVTGRLDALDLLGDTEIEGPSYGIALYDFEGVENEDLSFRENEKIYLLQRLNEEWYLGRNRRGCEGIFPVNYVKIKVPLKSENGLSDNSKFTKNNAVHVTNIHNSNKVRVIYKFIPETTEDLPLNINENVTVLYRINDNWLYGEIGNRRGQFPANFIEYIPENLSQLKHT